MRRFTHRRISSSHETCHGRNHFNVCLYGRSNCNNNNNNNNHHDYTSNCRYYYDNNNNYYYYGNSYHSTDSTSTCWRRRIIIVSPVSVYTSHLYTVMRHMSTVSQATMETSSSSSLSSSSSVMDNNNNNNNNNNNTNNNNNNTNNNSNSGADITEPRELQFHEDFIMDEEDVHYLLLHEAHLKHGVLLNVPPQLAPTGTPPEVPEVILPSAQKERLRGLKLAYEPTHMPPPLSTTGTRQLIIEDRPISTVTTPKTGSSTINTTNTINTTTTIVGKGGSSTTAVVMRRLPVDPTMRFHCSACGKPFRLEISAEHHVKLKHPSNAKAIVLEGPGAGEIIDEAATIITTPSSSSTINNTTSRGVVGVGVGVVGQESAGVTGSSQEGNTSLTDKPQEKTISTTSTSTNTTNTTTSSSTTTTSGVSSVKVPYNKATLSLPSESLVDEMLNEIWDTVAASREDVPKQNAANAYIPFSAIVEGTADRRAEMAANVKPTARATPEGAAPGIKKTGMISGGSMLATKTRATGQILPIKELVKKYPNPFGDSPNAALQELENEPVNPFIPQEELAIQLQVAREDGSPAVETVNSTSTTASNSNINKKEMEKAELRERLRASKPNLARSASIRRFTCPICEEKLNQQQQQEEDRNNEVKDTVPSFRLLDALLDHVETMHEGEELTEDQLQTLYETQRRSVLHVSSESLSNDKNGTGNNNTNNNNSGGIKDSKDSNKNASLMDMAIKLKSLPEELQQAAPPSTVVEQQSLSVHVRAGSNTVLLGRIADIQHGFLGSTAVTQYVLEVDGDDRVSTKTTITTEKEKEEEKEKENQEIEKELIVIRCMGDNFPAALLKEQVKPGSVVLVQGTLRMNRHIDAVSKRMHAYPFVQVVPPLGCVRVVR